MRSTLTDDGASDGRERRLRLRHRFWEHRSTVALALVVVLALGAWASYGAYVAPAETTEQRLEHSWTATGEFHHRAPVAEPATVFADVDVLEDEPLYYTAVSPTAETTFVAGYEADRGEDVDVTVAIDLRYRSVDREEEVVYWSERERLATLDGADVAPGEEVAATAELNVSAVADRVDAIEDELGASPGETEIDLVVEREIEGTIDGERRLAADTLTVPVEHDGSTYRFGDDGGYDERHEEYRTETVAVAPGPLRSVGGPLALLVGLAGLAGVAVASSRLPAPTTAEREWLTYREDREDFDEVIVAAALPEGALEGPRATVDSLAALADLGIDVGEVVVHDRRTGLYVVDHDGRRYVYEPPRHFDGAEPGEGVPLEYPDASDGAGPKPMTVLENDARSGGSDANGTETPDVRDAVDDVPEERERDERSPRSTPADSTDDGVD